MISKEQRQREVSWLNFRDAILRITDEKTAMDKLQSAGIVSDHCVWLLDIAEEDRNTALNFLRK